MTARATVLHGSQGYSVTVLHGSQGYSVTVLHGSQGYSVTVLHGSQGYSVTVLHGSQGYIAYRREKCCEELKNFFLNFQNQIPGVSLKKGSWLHCLTESSDQ
jgi:hypothetical protein